MNGFILLMNDFLDTFNDSFPAFSLFWLLIRTAKQDEEVNSFVSVEVNLSKEVKEHVTLGVEFASVSIGDDHFPVHDILIDLPNKGDDKVQDDNQHEHYLEKPNAPNHNQFGLWLLCGLWKGGWADIANGILEGV